MNVLDLLILLWVNICNKMYWADQYSAFCAGHWNFQSPGVSSQLVHVTVPHEAVLCQVTNYVKYCRNSIFVLPVLLWLVQWSTVCRANETTCSLDWDQQRNVHCAMHSWLRLTCIFQNSLLTIIPIMDRFSCPVCQFSFFHLPPPWRQMEKVLLHLSGSPWTVLGTNPDFPLNVMFV